MLAVGRLVTVRIEKTIGNKVISDSDSKSTFTTRSIIVDMSEVVD